MASVVALAVTVRLKDRAHSVRRKFGGRKQVGHKREGERDDCAIAQAKKFSGDGRARSSWCWLKSPNESPSAWREVDEAPMVQPEQRYPEHATPSKHVR